MKFTSYPIISEIKTNLERQGFKKPTDIQYKAIPPILKGEDLLAIAQTGTGKTAAFVIPILHILSTKRISERRDGIKCLVMVPTRELCIQVEKVFAQFSKGTGVKSMALYGGVDQEDQIDKLLAGVDVLVTTPGRMFDLNKQGFVRLTRVEILVLDEADHMLQKGFIKDIEDTLARLPLKKQVLFFSATINEKIKDLAYGLVHKPVRIQLSPKDPVSKNINHSILFITMDEKRFFLERVINDNEGSKIIVFVRTKVRAERVKKAMERVGLSTTTLHGDIEQKDRLEALKKFKNNENKVLIATDVSARGIDVPGVDIVVNYDLPDVAENYVHRVGRTGRGKEKGTAISFCSEEEKEILQDIEGYLGSPIKITQLDKDDMQATKDFSADTSESLSSILDEIGHIRDKQEKKRKHNKKKKK